MRNAISFLECIGVCGIMILLAACSRQQQTEHQPADVVPQGVKIGRYTVTEVRDGGSLKGMVTVAGNADSAIARMGERYVTTGQPECMNGSTEKPQQKLLCRNGRLKNVVVYLVNCDSGKVPERGSPVLDQVHCDFTPHVLALMAYDSVAIVNSDPIVHSTHGYAGIRTIFNIATPTKGWKYYVKFSDENVIRCICDAGHPWMEAYIHVLPNPYFAVTGDDGSFTINDIPPGMYRVCYSHELWNDTTRTVTVLPGASADASQIFNVRNIIEQ